MSEEQQHDVQEQREADQHTETVVDSSEDSNKSRDTTLAKISQERREARERARKAEAELEELREIQRKADEQKALEEGNYKQLLEQREAELAEARGELTKRELKDKRQALARKHKVHEDDMELVDLITATDDDEVEAWIKRIAKRSAVTDGLDTDSGKRSAQGNGKQKQESLLANYEFGKRR